MINLAFSNDLVLISPDKQIKITIQEEPCSGKIKLLLDKQFPQLSGQFKQAEIDEFGKSFPGCWLEKDGFVFIVGEGWAFQPLPKHIFKEKYI